MQNFLGRASGELTGFPRLVSFHHCLVFIFISKVLGTEGYKSQAWKDYNTNYVLPEMESVKRDVYFVRN
jgi:hypothetical protein